MTPRSLTPPSRPPARLLVGIALVIGLLAGCRPEEGDGDECDDCPGEGEEVDCTPVLADGALGYSALSLSSAKIDEVVAAEGQLWARADDWLYEVQGGRMIPALFDEGYRTAARTLLLGPDGAAWTDSHRFECPTWKEVEGRSSFGWFPEWEETAGVVALLGHPEEDIHGCEDEDGNEISCPPGDRTIGVWTTSGYDTEAVPANVAQVAANSLDHPIWSGLGVVRDRQGTSQDLGATITDLAFDGDVPLATTDDGKLWRGALGAMVPDLDLEVGLVDVEAAGGVVLVVTADGDIWGNTASAWAPIPVATSPGDRLEELYIDGDRLYGRGSRCVYGGTLAGIEPLACQSPVSVWAVEWSAGELFTVGDQNATRWSDGEPVETWALPHRVGGLVANDDEVQAVTSQGIFALRPNQEPVPIALPGGYDLAAAPYIDFYRGQGWGPYGDGCFWFAWNGEGWVDGHLDLCETAPRGAADGAAWTLRFLDGSTQEILRQAPGEDPVVLWTGGRGGGFEHVVGDHVILGTKQGFYELFADGQTQLVPDQQTGELLLNPKTQELWQGAQRWDGDQWVDGGLDLPGIPTGFGQDGTPYLLAGDLWWTSP